MVVRMPCGGFEDCDTVRYFGQIRNEGMAAAVRSLAADSDGFHEALESVDKIVLRTLRLLEVLHQGKDDVGERDTGHLGQFGLPSCCHISAFQVDVLFRHHPELDRTEARVAHD